MTLSDRMRRRPVLVAAVVGALIVVVVGVGIAVFANPFAAKAPATGQTTWQAITDKIRDGQASKEVALQAFAYIYDIDIPGVQVPQGTNGADAPEEGTLAVQWVQQYWDQLTPDQQAAITPYIEPGPNDKVIDIDLETGRSTQISARMASVGALEVTRLAPNDEPSGALTEAVENELLTDIAHIGPRLGISPISGGFFIWKHVQLTMSDQDGGLAAFSTKAKLEDGVYSPCLVTVYRNTWQNEQPVNGGVSDRLHVLISHEVVHCYQNVVASGTDVIQKMPKWIWEGTAMWLAADDTGLLERQVPIQWREEYFGRPGRSLTNRSYDAYGYFALLKYLNRDLWSLMRPAWQAASKAVVTPGQSPSTAFMDVIHGDDSDVRNAWAPSFVRGPWGDPWIAYGFGLPDDAEVTRQPIVAYPAPGYLGEIDSRANVVNEVQDSAGEIVMILTDGIANVHDNAGNWDLAIQSAKYCTVDNCICPPDTLRAGERVATNHMTLPFVLAINSEPGGAVYRVVGRKLRDECGPKETEEPAPAPNDSTGPPLCGNGCAGSNGDPHLRTVNNVYYDFQAAGEFTLLRSPDSSLEIQARQEPYQDLDHIAINTAVVARDNGHKVGIYFDGESLTAHVDGSVVDATTPIDLGNGGQISEHERGFEIDFPDGTQLWALSIHSWGINAQIRPSEGLRQDGVGLLGPVAPGGLSVPKLPDGTRLPRPADKHQQFQLTYETFANAWRVSAASSLFDYDAGKSTASYTDATFPAEQSATTPADLTDDQRAQAADACSDTTDLGLLEQCLFDVSVTDDDGFATVYAAISELINEGPGTLDLPIDGGPTPTPTPTPGPPSTAGPTATPVATPTNALLTGLQSVKGSAVGPDGTLYLSVAYPDGTYKLVAVDPATGTVINEVDALGGGQVAVAAGSVWVGEFNGGSDCSITRLDASTLGVQTTIPTACGFSGTTLASTGDAVWFIDSGVRRIDPATNTPDDPISLPFPNGFLYGTSTGLVYGEVSSGWYRLPVGQSELQSLGVHSVPVFAAGAGIWNQNQQTAEFFDSDGPASQSIPIDGPLVSADDGAVYVEQTSTADFTNELWRYPNDGGDPSLVAAAPEPYGDKTFSYFDNDPLLVSPAGGLVKAWVAFASATQESALFVQAIPISE